jgi:hypothetical protein
VSRPPDDVAQVVLRALVAWPVLASLAVQVDRVVQACALGPTSWPPLSFGLGVGLGAALAVGVVEVALLPLGRRAPRLRPIVELPLLALLSPAALLGAPEPTGAACALAVQSLLQRPRGPLRSGKALILGAVVGGWALLWTHDVPGWEQAASLVGLGALAAVFTDKLAGGGAPIATRPWRSWLALVAALVLGVAAGGLLRPLHLGGGASGLEARVHFGLRLGADPFALRRWTETLGHRPGQGEGWDRVLRLSSGGLSMDLDHLLLTRAAEAGDRAACRELWQRAKRAHAHFGPSEEDRRWLRLGAALGDPECEDVEATR